jgi:DNA-binding NarL/FixJ family response regulator
MKVFLLKLSPIIEYGMKLMLEEESIVIISDLHTNEMLCCDFIITTPHVFKQYPDDLLERPTILLVSKEELHTLKPVYPVCGVIENTSNKEELIALLKLCERGCVVYPKNKLQHEVSQQLTSRELEILTLVANGKSNREIAEDLFLSKRAIEYHLTKAYKKLNVTSRTMAIKNLIELG